MNGAAGALGMIVAALNSVHIAYGMDGGNFVLRGWHVFALFFLIAAAHLVFNPNPMWTSATLKAAEEERAKRKKSA